MTFGSFSEPRALDPVDGFSSGTAGGTELIALYDTIMSWDVERSEYVPRTAESLVPNADHSQWTLKLKSGITFRDGTPYDAEAVKLSIERHKAGRVNPARLHVRVVQDVKVIDPLTVEFTLTQPWAGFPDLLAGAPGMLVSPTALRALGDPSDPGYAEKKAAFNLHPVGAGAGPFEIVSFKPKESITMKRNPDYWGGEPYLDELRFVTLAGTPQALEAFNAGTADMVFLRSPAATAKAEEDGLTGYRNVQMGGGVLVLNHGAEVTCQGGKPETFCTGQADGTKITTNPPTRDPLVRRAIAAAIDPDVINERANGGTGQPGNELFQESFAFYPGVSGPTVDPAAAKRYLDEAKAKGYDGKIRVLCSQDRREVALAVETMLRAVGFDVTATTNLDAQAVTVEAFTNKNFDIVCSGVAISGDEGAPLKLLQNWGPGNNYGYANPAFEAAVQDIMAAATPDEKKEAYAAVAELFRDDVPALIFEATREFVAWEPKVQGVGLTKETMFHLDKAWLER